MAYTEGLCSKLQVNLNEIAGINAPALKRQKVGMVDSLMSDINRSQMTAQVVPTNGKFQQVQVNWLPQACDGDVVTSCKPDCNANVTPEPKEALISSFDCIKYKMQFDENEMRKLCEADNVWVGQNIMNAMNAINVSLERSVLAKYATNVGCDFAGNSDIQVPLFTSTGNPNPMAWAFIKHTFEETGLMGSPIMVGGGSLDLYAKAQQIACCNSGGMDMSKITDSYFYHSPYAPSALGTGIFGVYAPGSIQLILWNKYLGDYAKKTDSWEHGTIIDPFTGLIYDLKTNYDDCAEKWFVELGLNWNLFNIPQLSHCGSECINGTLTFQDCSTNQGLECPQP
jgi:hypothetical protein